MPDQRRLLVFRADHVAGRIAQEQQRDVVRVAQLHEARCLVGAVGVDRAAEVHRVVGDHADRPAVDPRQHGDDAGAEAGAQLERRAGIDERVDDRADVVAAQAVGRQQVAQRFRVGGFLRGDASLEEREIAPSRVDAFGLFTGQIGYAFNNALLYVKGGAAVTSDRYRNFTTATGVQVTNSVNDTRWGAAVGVGLEYGFAPNWTAGIEYDHMFMQDKNYTLLNNGAAFAAGTLFATDRIRQDVDIVTVRVNYRWGGPVVAKY